MIHFPLFLSVCPSVCLIVCLSVCQPVCPFVQAGTYTVYLLYHSSSDFHSPFITPLPSLLPSPPPPPPPSLYHSPFPHGMEAPHSAESETDVLRPQVLLALVELVGRVPVMEALVPLLLDFLGGEGEEVTQNVTHTTTGS